jgi:hypothetical protein
VDLTVETWKGSQRGLEVKSCDVGGLPEVIGSVEGARSATITLVLGGQILMVWSSRGKYRVRAMLHGGTLDRRSTTAREGMVEFVVDGKVSSVPGRLVLAREKRR